MDRERKLRLEGTLAADERAKSKDDAAFQRRCTGSLNECPFSFHADGGPLINVDPNEPYTFTVDAQAADIALALHSPVKLEGTLESPTVGIDSEKTLLQAGEGTVLDVLLSPIGAVLAFIDVGLAKNAGCSALLAQTAPFEAGEKP